MVLTLREASKKMPGLISVRSSVVAVLNGCIIPGKNLITTLGELYYAELVAGGGFTTDFSDGGLHLGTSNTLTTVSDTDVNSELISARRVVASGYPRYDDDDDDNRGAGADVYTWLYEYSRETFVASGIIEGAIVDDLAAPTKALCHFLFGARFPVIAEDALKLFINHTVSTVTDGETAAVIDPDGVIDTVAVDSEGAVSATWESRFPPFHRRNSWTDVT